MRKLLIFFVFTLFGCQEELIDKPEEQHFDLPAFTQDVLSNLDKRSADVSKKFILNGKSETQLISKTDSAFWSKELNVLRKTDLNTARFRGLLNINEGSNDPNSNLLVDHITTKTNDLDFKKIDIFYLDSREQVRLIKLEYASKNFFAESSNQLTVWFNEYNDQLLVDSLVTKAREKVMFQKERSYESHLIRIRE